MNTEPEEPNDEPTDNNGFFAKLVSFIKKIIKFIVDGIPKLLTF